MSNNHFITDNSVEDKVEEVAIEKLETVEETSVMTEPEVMEDVIKESTKTDSVVVYAIRDLVKPGHVSLTKGYNTITKSQHKKWEGSASVRLASQEEIEKYVN